MASRQTRLLFTIGQRPGLGYMKTILTKIPISVLAVIGLISCDLPQAKPPPDLFRKIHLARVGQGPGYLASGDLDLDGFPDIISCNSKGHSLSILWGKGDGTFEDPQTQTTGLEPSFAMITDVNQDEVPDLIFNSRGSDAVLVQLGRGKRQFLKPVRIPTGKVPLAIIPGNFNEDDALDLAVTLTFNKVQIFLGVGDGSFKQGDTYQTGSRSLSGVASDFDRDGHTDLALAVSSSTTSSIRLYSGSGEGTFKQVKRIALNLRPLILIQKDMNGDGTEDLVFSTAIQDNLYAMMVKADGTFEEPEAFSGGGGPISLVAEDFDGDHKPDVAVANSRSSSFSLITRTREGGFYFPTRDYVTGSTPLALTSSDFNQDGKMDIAVSSNTDGTVEVYLNQRGLR